MKKIVLTALLTCFIIGQISANVNSAAVSMKIAAFKIGYFNMDSLLMLMPEAKRANDSIQIYAELLENEKWKIELQIQDKIQYIRDSTLNVSKLIRQLHEEELIAMKERQENFLEMAKEDLKNYKEMRMKPIYAKIKAAAQRVAARLGYAYILDTSDDRTPVVYASQSYNVFNEMCVELKILKK